MQGPDQGRGHRDLGAAHRGRGGGGHPDAGRRRLPHRHHRASKAEVPQGRDRDHPAAGEDDAGAPLQRRERWDGRQGDLGHGDAPRVDREFQEDQLGEPQQELRR